MTLSPAVILLHGLARTSRSMRPLAHALQARGHTVHNIGYASRSANVEALALATVERALTMAGASPAEPVDFVTHSMGGILLRVHAERHGPERIRRAVMLAPPNHGSELVDRMRTWLPFRFWNGPAGTQLGTGPEGIAARLGPVAFSLGVIAGSKSLNPLLGAGLPAPHDGKVSVASTRVEGMSDHVVLPVTHTFMMGNPRVAQATAAFLRDGRFSSTG